MATNLITQARLKNLLHYDADTGVFTWVYTRPKCPKNAVAGWRCKDGYTMICLDYRIYRAHRLAWLYVYGYIPEYIDHINNIKDDNRLVNLRPATKQQNAFNTKISTSNTSKVKNVSWSKSKSKWKSYIKLNGKQIHLGYTIDFFEACCMSLSAISKYHKEFSYKS